MLYEVITHSFGLADHPLEGITFPQFFLEGQVFLAQFLAFQGIFYDQPNFLVLKRLGA